MKRPFALLVLVAMLLIGCGPSRPEEGAREPVDLKKENERLKSQIVLLKKENESLRRDLEEMQKKGISGKAATHEIQQSGSRERQKQESALANMEASVDSVEGLTLYEDRTTKDLSDKSAFYLYIEYMEQEEPRLRLKIRYAGKEWLLIDSFLIKAGDRRFTLFPVDLKRQAIGGGTVIEVDDRPATAEIYEIIEAVISSEEAIIRYSGKNGYKDRTITREEKAALQNVLDAYKALGGTLPLAITSYF